MKPVDEIEGEGNRADNDSKPEHSPRCTSGQLSAISSNHAAIPDLIAVR